MSDLDGLTIRHRRLAAELRQLRGRSGMTGDQVADELGRSPFKVSKLEAESASLPAGFAADVSTETEAETIWNWEPHVVPGLLQTEDYARSFYEGWQTMVTMSPEIQWRITIRLEWRNLLDSDPPLCFFVMLDESVFKRRIRDVAVMRDKLTHLLECAERDNIDVRVLPLNAYHPIGAGSFTYTQFPSVEDVPFNDVVAIENLTGNCRAESQSDTYQYRLAFEQLAEESLDDGESVELISKHTYCQRARICPVCPWSSKAWDSPTFVTVIKNGRRT